MPTLNLIRDPWIPVARGKTRGLIRPADLTSDYETDPVTEILWPRADFRAAQMELLIGLLATACPPEDDSAWREWWEAPPSPEALEERLRPYEKAFDFDGDFPRFLQDGGDLGTEEAPVSGLLIEQPGANTEKNNADLFVKRGRVGVLARSTAAIALFTLQSYAPSGGAGHRTGLRGGGPLTTLVKPPRGGPGKEPLWRFVWLNVSRYFDPDKKGWPLDEPARAFPWLGPTRISDKDGVPTNAVDIHPVQCFWGMPRRIALSFEPNPGRIACDVTGEIETVIIRTYRTRPYGVNYQTIGHPLTPTYRVKADAAEKFPVHPQPGGIAYRHWLGFVQEGPTRGLAPCVAKARGRFEARTKLRLAMSGYDMDNMKARGFVEAEMPLLIASDAERQEDLDLLAKRLVEGAAEVAGQLLGQIKAARGEDGDGLDLIRETFFSETEQDFFDTLEKGFDTIEEAPEGSDDPALLTRICEDWLDNGLKKKALDTFDRHVPAEAAVAGGDFKAMERMANARALLGAALSGYGPAGGKLFELMGIAAPRKRKKKAGEK